MRIQRYRDLSLLHMSSGETIVTACDSCGAVGEKIHDVLRATSEVTGALTTRVALMEVLCTGARVKWVYDTLSCEMHPTGARVISGIRAELEQAGLAQETLSGSTEENFVTTMTAVGVVVIGICSDRPRLGGVQATDVAVLIATPKSGEALAQPSQAGMVTYAEVRALLAEAGVIEIVPCGSKGVLYEAGQIAKLNGLVFNATEKDKQLLQASAGTATCVVAAVRRGELLNIAKVIGKDRMRVIGYFE